MKVALMGTYGNLSDPRLGMSVLSTALQGNLLNSRLGCAPVQWSGFLKQSLGQDVFFFHGEFFCRKRSARNYGDEEVQNGAWPGNFISTSPPTAHSISKEHHYVGENMHIFSCFSRFSSGFSRSAAMSRFPRGAPKYFKDWTVVRIASVKTPDMVTSWGRQ